VVGEARGTRGTLAVIELARSCSVYQWVGVYWWGGQSACGSGGAERQRGDRQGGRAGSGRLPAARRKLPFRRKQRGQTRGSVGASGALPQRGRRKSRGLLRTSRQGPWIWRQPGGVGAARSQRPGPVWQSSGHGLRRHGSLHTATTAPHEPPHRTAAQQPAHRQQNFQPAHRQQQH